MLGHAPKGGLTLPLPSVLARSCPNGGRFALRRQGDQAQCEDVCPVWGCAPVWPCTGMCIRRGGSGVDGESTRGARLPSRVLRGGEGQEEGEERRAVGEGARLGRSCSDGAGLCRDPSPVELVRPPSPVPRCLWWCALHARRSAHTQQEAPLPVSVDQLGARVGCPPCCPGGPV